MSDIDKIKTPVKQVKIIHIYVYITCYKTFLFILSLIQIVCWITGFSAADKFIIILLLHQGYSSILYEYNSSTFPLNTGSKWGSVQLSCLCWCQIWSRLLETRFRHHPSGTIHRFYIHAINSFSITLKCVEHIVISLGCLTVTLQNDESVRPGKDSPRNSTF